MKNVFNGLNIRQDTAKKSVSELEEISVKTFKTEMKGKKITRWNKISKKCGTLKKSVTYM